MTCQLLSKNNTVKSFEIYEYNDMSFWSFESSCRGRVILINNTNNKSLFMKELPYQLVHYFITLMTCCFFSNHKWRSFLINFKGDTVHDQQKQLYKVILKFTKLMTCHFLSKHRQRVILCQHHRWHETFQVRTTPSNCP